MKRFYLFFATILVIKSVYSQHDSTVSFNFFSPELQNISFSPKELFTSIRIGVRKDFGNQNKIGVELVMRGKKPVPSVRIDSIIIKSSDNEFLTINNPQNDTVYIRNDGSVLLSIIHLLDSRGVGFIKGKKIAGLILIADGHPLEIIFSNKSRDTLNKQAKQNL